MTLPFTKTVPSRTIGTESHEPLRANGTFHFSRPVPASSA
jgi:hypothetical protein